METLKTSTGETLFDLTSFVADIPASHSQHQAIETVQMTQDISGLGYERPLATYSQDTQSWKMYGATYLWGDCPSLENLPASGMTRNGELYLRPILEPATDVIVSSLWPTPLASETSSTRGSATGPTLQDSVMMTAPGETNKVSVQTFLRVREEMKAQGKSLAQTREQFGHPLNGKLNPTWLEWLMGFPPGWTELQD
jgi:hypothetical protein